MSEASGAELRIERDGDCWTLVLDRASKANALSASLVEALISAVGEAQAAGAQVLALRGEGRNFSAGFDFGGYDTEGEDDLVRRFARVETLLQAVARSRCLTVAFAHGRNFGAGVDLFGACRWRVAAPEATFRMPGLAFGLVLGTRRFAAIVGRERARSILESLATFDATRAHEMDFVTHVAAPDAWPGVIDEALATARAIPAASRALLYDVLDGGTDAADMADLVRSASAPGLKERIRTYLDRNRGQTKVVTK